MRPSARRRSWLPCSTPVCAGTTPIWPASCLPGYDFVTADAPNDFTTANDGNGVDADPSDPGDWVTQAESDKPAACWRAAMSATAAWHGTQTAALVGAATNNSFGMASVGRNVRVLPVRVLGKCGGFISDVIAGMYWAAGIFRARRCRIRPRPR